MLEKKKNLNLSLHALTPADSLIEPSIIALTAQELGCGYITSSSLQPYWQTPHSHQLLGAFLPNQELIAIRAHHILSTDELQSLLHRFQDFQVSLPPLPHPVGKLDFSAVHRSYQGRGIGSLLLRHALHWLSLRGCQSFLSLSWQSPNPIQSSSLLEKFGFQQIAPLRQWWSETSLLTGSHCPHCGPPPCLCNAWLYLKII